MVHLRVIKLLISGLIFVGVVSAVSASDPQREEEIRAWLTEKIAEKRPVRELEEGIYLKWEVETTSGLSIQEINRRWEKVAPYPDHPERENLAYHRQLKQEPLMAQGELWYAGSGAWLQVVDRGPIWGLLRSGGLNKDRWMLSTSGSVPAPNAPPGYKPKVRQHLTAIRAGKPYPGSLNIGRFFEDSRELLANLLLVGIPWATATATIERVTFQGGSWSAFLVETPDASVNLRIQGRFHAETREPIITKIDHVNANSIARRSSGDSDEYIFSKYVVDPISGKAFPSVVIRNHYGGISAAYRVIAVESIRPAEVQELAALPEIGPEVTINDFREDGNPELLRTPESSQLLWEITEFGDQYRLLTEPALGDAAQELVELPAAGVGGAGSSLKRILALGFTLILIVMVSVFYYRKRQGSHY